MTSITSLPVGFTMGDAAGIGPEIIVKLFADGLHHAALVYGDAGALTRLRALSTTALPRATGSPEAMEPKVATR
mgnify:CR=1 FL=1